MKKNIKIKFFTRNNGYSKGIYSSLNCGMKSNDKLVNIKNNIYKAKNNFSREKKILVLPNQYHSNKAIIVKNSIKNYKCDGLVTNSSEVILGITTADCIPIILTDHDRGIIGICHAGWKGLVGGIIENTIKKMSYLSSNRSDISAFIGPCIRKSSYEVSRSFIDGLNREFQTFALKKKENYYYDLPKLAKFILNKSLISKIHDTKKNTFADSNYFSFRESKKRGLSDYGRNISMVSLN